MSKFRIVSLFACGGLALATVAPGTAHADRIVVLNLGLHVGDAELAALFAPSGPVHSALVLRQAGSGASRGIGVVEMDCTDGLNALMVIDGINHDGRILQAHWADDASGHC